MKNGILVLCAALLAACGDDGISPEERLLTAGTYDYFAVIDRPEGSGTPDTLQGQIVITLATPDSIRAVFQVPTISSDTVTGRWNIDAFTLAADPNPWTGTINHRLWRAGAAAEMQCTVSYVWYPPSGGTPQVEVGACDVG